MDLISHIFFGLILYGGVDPFLILGTILPDFDKVWTYPKKRIRGSESRTIVTELPIMPLVAIGGYFISPAFTLGVISHMFLDFITGETRPFTPLVKDKVSFNWKLRYKIIIAAIIQYPPINIIVFSIFSHSSRSLKAFNKTSANGTNIEPKILPAIGS